MHFLLSCSSVTRLVNEEQLSITRFLLILQVLVVSSGVLVHLIPSGNWRILKVVPMTEWVASHQSRERTQEYIFKVLPHSALSLQLVVMPVKPVVLRLLPFCLLVLVLQIVLYKKNLSSV